MRSASRPPAGLTVCQARFFFQAGDVAELAGQSYGSYGDDGKDPQARIARKRWVYVHFPSQSSHDMRPEIRCALLVFGASAVLACGGTTAPPVSTPVRYDVTTNVRQYWFPVITPGCSSTGCAHDSVPAPNSSLAGSLQLEATRPLTGGDGLYKVATFDFMGLGCRSGASCTSTEFASSSTGFTIAADTLAQPAWFFSGGSEYIVFGTGRAAGDSITGKFSWALNGGTATSGYSGTYVARRHR